VLAVEVTAGKRRPSDFEGLRLLRFDELSLGGPKAHDRSE